MTPERARDQIVAILQETIKAAGEHDWAIDAGGIPLPEPCTADSQDGVAFTLGAKALPEKPDRESDVNRVVDYWTSIGVQTRIVTDPVPVAFGVGGPVSAISFSTAPTYAISVAGNCVPGDPFDFFESGPLPSPSQTSPETG